MKSLKEKSRLLVEQILSESFLDANSTLASLIMEAEENREEEVGDSLGDEGVGDEAGEEGTDEATAEEGEEINTDGIDEPSNGSPNLGDSLDRKCRRC